MAAIKHLNVPIEGDCLLVAEVINWQITMPADLHDGCVIERAQGQLICFVSELINSLFFFHGNPFESDLDPVTKTITPLDQANWRYYYVRKKDAQIPFAVCLASSIIEPCLYLGPRFLCLKGQPSVGAFGGLQNHFWNPTRWWNSGKTITDLTISEWRENARALETIEKSHPEILRSVTMFWTLGANDAVNDQLTQLAYFSVIESLLTHKPDPKDPTDSIGRQIRAKMRLASNRIANKLDYSIFNVKDPDKVWGLLYSYRSDLAHGSSPDFKRGLQGLHSEKYVVAFLQATCRSLLRQAIREPVLFTDLKKC